ncbi:hypothetical protein HanRHA438_Chr01g0000481 [Helianthus annuus]|uniref:Uncharacterized protein n=1 Tax=Helianthus annuus TaxID=4232 RepID=A0A9K3P0M1_HELAN|nr:hypothetical protein HanXRQr2_Chr01g0000461 [Helianthus annuus]KAJ0610128.1 hypothetical protein HanHA300_Chr01g0000421 [Helianthus annuus]KAJ0620711.1 hypothetical protein HanIR_Chr01g0000561 [Helianthus annuus]KAJ0625332.1 hypothetical protein HanHA89_Chr01g0000481 [Helianthus annuus]KAJ0781751.1 hypothetical protein HanLR1_Chr01g0000391 [Helianthus annuus]
MLKLSPNLFHNFSNNLHQCRDSSNRPCLRVAEPVRRLMDAGISIYHQKFSKTAFVWC